MKHVARTNVEFVKSALIKDAAKWDSLSYEAQKEYLGRHPKSKRKLTAKPGKGGKSLADVKVGLKKKKLTTVPPDKHEFETYKEAENHFKKVFGKLWDEYGMELDHEDEVVLFEHDDIDEGYAYDRQKKVEAALRKAGYKEAGIYDGGEQLKGLFGDLKIKENDDDDSSITPVDQYTDEQRKQFADSTKIMQGRENDSQRINDTINKEFGGDADAGSTTHFNEDIYHEINFNEDISDKKSALVTKIQQLFPDLKVDVNPRHSDTINVYLPNDEHYLTRETIE